MKIVKSTTLLIDGRKIKFNFKKVYDYYFGDKFAYKSDRKYYCESSVGRLKIKFLSDVNMFEFTAVSDVYNTTFYIEGN